MKTQPGLSCWLGQAVSPSRGSSDTLQSHCGRQAYNKQRAHHASAELQAEPYHPARLSPAQVAHRGQRWQCPAAQLGERERSPQRQEYCTLQRLFPRQWWLGPSVLHVGATGLSRVLIPSLFATIISTSRLARASITAAIVLTHHSHCSTLPLGQAGGTLCNVCIRTSLSFCASCSWSSLGWRVQPSPPTTSISMHGQARRKPSSPKLRQASDSTELKIHLFQTKVQSPNGQRIQEKCGRPSWWPASSTSTSLRRNPARSLD